MLRPIRPVAALAAALVAAALLVACGGGDDNGSDGGNGASGGERAPGATEAGGRSEPGAQGDGSARGNGGAGEGSSDSRPEGAPAEDSDPPAAGFRDTSGVTEIPGFGKEASAGERSAVQRALAAYLGEVREGRWARACGHLSAATAAELMQLAARPQRAESQNCAEGLRLAVEELPREADPYFGPAEVAALRIKRDGGGGEGSGFALFHGSDGTDYWMAMRREGGRWKAISTLPAELR